MRFWVVGGVFAALMLAGCAETQLDEETTDDAAVVDAGGADVNGTADSLAGDLVVTVENTTLQPGSPFNVTLAYEGDNATDGANLTWQVAFQNATESVPYNGTGLPAVLQANLSLLGNVTLIGNATDGASEVGFEPIALVIEAPVAPPADPCADARTQEPVAGSGSVLLPGDEGISEFEVLPCQVGLSVSIDILVGGDVDYALYDASGAEVDSSAAFTAEGVVPESGLAYSDASGLKPGTWSIGVTNFATAATDYDFTVTFD